LKGGKARAKRLTPEEHRKIATPQPNFGNAGTDRIRFGAL